MTDADLEHSIAMLAYADSRERAKLMRPILEELSRCGGFRANIAVLGGLVR